MNESRLKRPPVHWRRHMKDAKQLVFDALKAAAPNNDVNAEIVQTPMRGYCLAENELLYQLADKENGLEIAGRAITMIAAVAFFAGERNPAAFKNWEKKRFQSLAENARTSKVPQHILDRIVIEEMEKDNASGKAVATRGRSELLRLTLDAINARIAEERKRYRLSIDKPYYKPDSIYRRYRDAKKRTAI
jgi:hypothetical protein